MPIPPREPQAQAENQPQPQAVLTSKQAAEYLGVSPVALRMMRYRGKAPPHFLYGARDKRYHLEDLDAWLAKKRKQSRPKRGRGRPEKGEVVLKFVSKPFIAVSKFIKDKTDDMDVKTASIPVVIILLILAVLAGVL